MSKRRPEAERPDAQRDESAEPLTDEEIESEEAAELPEREALSIVDLGNPNEFTLPFERPPEI